MKHTKATRSDFMRDKWEETEKIKWKLRNEKDPDKKQALWDKARDEHLLIPSDLRD